MRQKFKRKDQK